MKNFNLSKKEIIERIGYFRNKKGISAYNLGMELGHSKTYFYRIESGDINLTLDTFLEVLDILNVTTSEFFLPILDETNTELLTKINNLTKENKQVITNLINNLNK